MRSKSEKGRYLSDDNQTILGMPVDDMIKGAKDWWDARGKDIMRNRQFSNSMSLQQDALDATNPVHPNYIGDSNILRGTPWSILRPDEQFRIVIFFTVTKKRMENV